MGRIITRIVGSALIVAGIAGLAFSVIGLAVLIQVEQTVTRTITDQLGLVDRALTATNEGLGVAATSLDQAVQTVGTLKTTASEIGSTVGNSVPVLDSVSALLGEQLPGTIESTQATLMSASESAEAVDDLLAVVSAIPFLGTDAYSPEVPLSRGLEQVSASLQGIPESLRATREDLAVMRDNLDALEGTLGEMATNIGQIGSSLGGSQSVLKQYVGVVQDLQRLVASATSSLPSWLRWLRLAFSLLLVWLGIAQLALITQGWELIGRSRRRQSGSSPQ